MKAFRPWEALARQLGLEPDEGHRLVLMGGLVGILCCAYTIAKVARDALFLAEFGALALPYAYVFVAVATALLLLLEGWWAGRLSLVRTRGFHQYVAIACSVAAALAYPHAHGWTTALFYIWTGSQAMMLLPHFWVLALDLWDSRQARRVFPLLAGCGLLGGLAGGALAGWTSPLVQRVGLLWMLPVFLLAARALTARLEHRRVQRPRPRELSSSPWKIIRGSPYVMILVTALALSVIVGTLVDFQFKFLIHRDYPDPQALTQFLGRFYVALNGLSLLFQFAVAGWLLQRLGLGVSTGLQPVAVVALASWAVVAPVMWVVIAMRWVQGVLSQTLGKSTSEIYYTAIRPAQRRRIKPAVDLLVERWSDALVGVLLVVALHVLRVPIAGIAILTVVLTAIWIATLFALDRQYGRAFHQILSNRWAEPEDELEALRLPAARRALAEALGSQDEPRTLLALRLCGQVKDERIMSAVRECLRHASAAVRTAAVGAMESLGMADRDGVIAAFVLGPDEELRRAAVHYLLVTGTRRVEFAREVLSGSDERLHRYAIDALFERPCAARAALTLEWVDARLASDRKEHLLLAARALGALSDPATGHRLRALLEHPDIDVKRSALESAARQPSREFLDALLLLLTEPELHHEARLALAALGNPAVPGLAGMLEGAAGVRAQSLAADALAQIGSHRAVIALRAIARAGDLRLRHLGMRSLARVRVRLGEPVLPRHFAHRLFMRELRDYRDHIGPALALASHEAPEVRLLAESYLEAAGMALERAMQALACWYDPEPLIGVLDRLKSRDSKVAAPALDYLEHALPRAVFGAVRKVFEEPAVVVPAGDEAPDPLEARIEAAWKSEDAWLRACAVRASRCSTAFEQQRFRVAQDTDPRVRAEIEALSAPRAPRPAAVLQEAAC